MFRVSVSLRFTSMERSPRKGVWDDPVKCVQDKRGKTCHSMSSRKTFLKAELTHSGFAVSVQDFTFHFWLVFQFFLTYDLYIAAFAGAGMTVLALVSVCRTEHNHSVFSWRHSRRCRGILSLNLLKGWLSFIVLKCLGWLWEQLILRLEGVFSTVEMSWPHMWLSDLSDVWVPAELS